MVHVPPVNSKCVYVLRIGDWNPTLCQYTIPIAEKWAKRIGADFRVISTLRYPTYPVNYERFQVYELGRGYFWNIALDADYIFNPDVLEDPTWDGRRDPSYVYTEGGMIASEYFKVHPYFIKDGRNQGIGDSFVLSTYFTHEFWTPLTMTYEEAAEYCLRDSRQVSEFAATLNLARFSFKHDGVFYDKSSLYHLSTTGRGMDKELLIAKLKEYGVYEESKPIT